MSVNLHPLKGIRIVTIALNVPGPMAANRLHALGASVTKVEPLDGDPLRASSPHWYAELTTGIAIEKLDLKTAAGQAAIYEHLRDADLLLSSQRPSALDRLGLGWEKLHTQLPELCQIAIVGHPAPDQNLPGHDLTYLATYGLLQPPHLPPTLFADVAGSEQAAFWALAILRERDRTRVGLYKEVALADAAKRLAAPAMAGLTAGDAILGGGFPGYNIYRTKDGWIAVAALEKHFYVRLCEQLRITEPSYDRLAKCFAAETTGHWLQFAKEHDVPIDSIKTHPAEHLKKIRQ